MIILAVAFASLPSPSISARGDAGQRVLSLDELGTFCDRALTLRNLLLRTVPA